MILFLKKCKLFFLGNLTLILNLNLKEELFFDSLTNSLQNHNTVVAEP